MTEPRSRAHGDSQSLPGSDSDSARSPQPDVGSEPGDIEDSEDLSGDLGAVALDEVVNQLLQEMQEDSEIGAPSTRPAPHQHCLVVPAHGAKEIIQSVGGRCYVCRQICRARNEIESGSLGITTYLLNRRPHIFQADTLRLLHEGISCYSQPERGALDSSFLIH